MMRTKKSQPCDWDLCASGWAWIQEDEIIRNLQKRKEIDIQLVAPIYTKVFKS